jgi:glycosyltransferase involved in cell wall biosynthesis
MVKIGWLADQVGIVGGAELSGHALIQHAPEWAEVRFCPNNRRPPDDIELFILQNVVTYGRRWNDILAQGKIIKHFRDPWHPGDPVFRRFVLDNVDKVLFNSPLAMGKCPWPFDAPVGFAPPPVDLEAFRSAAQDEREGNIFVGRVDMLKGYHRAFDWALRNGETLDVYGKLGRNVYIDEPFVNYHGEQPYAALPAIYGKAKRFIFLPAGRESYSRTTVEAWAAGCELVLDREKIGAVWWIEQHPESLDEGPACEMFWQEVGEVIQ